MKGRMVLIAAVAIIMQAGAAYCCSPAEMVQKQKAFGEATKAAFARDPAGDEARKAKAMLVIERYRDLKNSTNGSYIIDQICKEHDELLAIYK